MCTLTVRWMSRRSAGWESGSSLRDAFRAGAIQHRVCLEVAFSREAVRARERQGKRGCVMWVTESACTGLRNGAVPDDALERGAKKENTPSNALDG